MSNCYCCINPGICHLEEDNGYENVGWCEKHCRCRIKDCNDSIKYRVEWTVGCENKPFTLYRDVCEEHSKEKYILNDNCNCSSTSRNITLIPYTLHCNAIS